MENTYENRAAVARLIGKMRREVDCTYQEVRAERMPAICYRIRVGEMARKLQSVPYCAAIGAFGAYWQHRHYDLDTDRPQIRCVRRYRRLLTDALDMLILDKSGYTFRKDDKTA